MRLHYGVENRLRRCRFPITDLGYYLLLASLTKSQSLITWKKKRSWSKITNDDSEIHFLHTKRYIVIRSAALNDSVEFQDSPRFRRVQWRLNSPRWASEWTGELNLVLILTSVLAWSLTQSNPTLLFSQPSQPDSRLSYVIPIFIYHLTVSCPEGHSFRLAHSPWLLNATPLYHLPTTYRQLSLPLEIHFPLQSYNILYINRVVNPLSVYDRQRPIRTTRLYTYVHTYI